MTDRITGSKFTSSDGSASWVDTPNPPVTEAPRYVPDPQLCAFYQVSTFQDLVSAMEYHIIKLQSKVAPTRDEQPKQVREG